MGRIWGLTTILGECAGVDPPPASVRLVCISKSGLENIFIPLKIAGMRCLGGSHSWTRDGQHGSCPTSSCRLRVEALATRNGRQSWNPVTELVGATHSLNLLVGLFLSFAPCEIHPGCIAFPTRLPLSASFPIGNPGAGVSHRVRAEDLNLRRAILGKLKRGGRLVRSTVPGEQALRPRKE